MDLVVILIPLLIRVYLLPVSVGFLAKTTQFEALFTVVRLVVVVFDARFRLFFRDFVPGLLLHEL